MYVQRGQFGMARYRSVDLSSRIEGASPHQLVQLLFDELLKAMDAMAAAMARRDFGRRGERQARALSILSGLETSLDFEQGGEIAGGLAAIYREARRLLIAAGREGDGAPLERARAMIAEIASAWEGIGVRNR